MEALVPIIVAVQNFHGLALPFVIDFVNRNILNSKIRFWASFVICVVIALAVNFNKVLEVNNWQDAGVLTGQVSFIFAQAQIVYKAYWENSKKRADLNLMPVR